MLYIKFSLPTDANQSTDQSQTGQLCVSPSIVAKFLEDELKSRDAKHCETCQCGTRDLTVLADIQKSFSVGTQTIVQNDMQNSLCLRCNSNLNSPSRADSPYLIKLVKSSDSVISETKSSVSVADSTAQNDKLFTPSKKDDLMVNPILSHHRLCDRTNIPHQPASTNITRTASIERSLNNEAITNATSTPKSLINQISKTASVDVDTISHKSNSNLSNISVKKTPEYSTSSIKNEPILSDEKVQINISGNIGSNEAEECNNSKGPSSTSKTVGSISNSLTHGPGNGSTNSLWSRTSSKEGAKLFENFNRNLIKTIKVSKSMPSHFNHNIKFFFSSILG